MLTHREEQNLRMDCELQNASFERITLADRPDKPPVSSGGRGCLDFIVLGRCPTGRTADSTGRETAPLTQGARLKTIEADGSAKHTLPSGGEVVDLLTGALFRHGDQQMVLQIWIPAVEGNSRVEAFVQQLGQVRFRWSG